MSALEQLEAFKAQAESELNALQLKANHLASENKAQKAELAQLRNTVNEVHRAAHRYVEEQRALASQAKSSEIAMHARLVCAHDVTNEMAEELKTKAEQLTVPIKVLKADGFDIDGVNPLKVVRDLQGWMRQKVKALTKFGHA